MIVRVIVACVFLNAIAAFPAAVKDATTTKANGKKIFCMNNPCHNGGTCVETGTSYACSCDRKFYGKLCQNSCPCYNGGRCLESEGESAPSCLCPSGAHGDICQFVWTEEAVNAAAAEGLHPQTIPFHVQQAWSSQPRQMQHLVNAQEKMMNAWEHGGKVHPLAIVTDENSLSFNDSKEEDEEDDEGEDETEADDEKEELEDEEGEKNEEQDDEMQAEKEKQAADLLDKHFTKTL